MKPRTILVTTVLGICAPFSPAGASERTAEHILTTPSTYEGQQVDLDVAFVRPVQWKSPVEDLAFFHAMTMDRNDLKAGGAILVAIPSAEAAAFAKKYGTDYEGRYEKDSLTGTLLASPGRGRHPQIWFVDTSGTAAALIEQKKLELQDDGGRPPREPGRRPGWRDGKAKQETGKPEEAPASP